ncbi:MAG TPA: methyltransferase [Nocardioides sp.]|nr:methyltransferase [Nocardioides sp.]
MSELLPAPALPHTLPFGPLSIVYDDRVMMPRPWTVLQSDWARELLDDAPPGPVLELCSGTGQIGLLAVRGTDRRLVCVEVDPVACEFAVENAAAAGRASRVDVLNLPLAAFAAGQLFPVIVADPPTVRTEHLGCFPLDPAGAIDGGEDGLVVARECLRVIDDHLHPEGAALLQLGSVAQTATLADELPDGLVAGEVRAEPGHGLVVKLVRPS